tara:strand:+ start:10780 stop:11307 length:528 start_codon:yes stop_codon:yes gene_type:complete
MKKILLVVLVSLGLQTQAQQSTPYFCCDSISYWTDQGQGLSVGLDTSGIVHDADTIEVLWTVCNSTMCYAGQGMYAFFGQIMTSDTIKVCYDALITEANSMETCSRCDSLVFDQNTYTWVLFNMGNPVGLPGFVIEEDGVRWWNDVIYDMQGRELKEIPVGVMYIKGGKINLRRK